MRTWLSGRADGKWRRGWGRSFHGILMDGCGWAAGWIHKINRKSAFAKGSGIGGRLTHVYSPRSQAPNWRRAAANSADGDPFNASMIRGLRSCCGFSSVPARWTVVQR